MADNVLRPVLLSGRSSMNGLVTFVALLGGVAAFGFIGLVFGPVVVAVGTALLDAYLAPIGVKPVRAKRQS
jgi:predicted PurR-regulated permease PerM